MIHLTIADEIGERHEYWETEVYKRHLKEPCCGRYKPYYVCYCYPNN